ncbi:MAG: hypothetical protein HRT72_11265 [Flavobacteriales bacterium]|nr:hypothetical protein [Flavobacteriales bacterium]
MIEKFRKKRADELLIVARAIDKLFGSNKGHKTVLTTPIITAAKQLEKNLLNLDRDKNWGYEIVNFKMPVETIKHVRPEGIKNVELSLNMKLVADSTKWGTLEDPLLELSFHVTLRAINSNKTSYLCFHIDKHDMAKFSTEPHPIYHIQYSPKPKNVSKEDFDYGNILHLDTPRIPHSPVDFTLGFGLLISSFLPSKWDKLMRDPFFKKTYTDYQIGILKPYAHTLADNWKPFNSNDTSWSPINHLIPYVV